MIIFRHQTALHFDYNIPDKRDYAPDAYMKSDKDIYALFSAIRMEEARRLC